MVRKNSALEIFDAAPADSKDEESSRSLEESVAEGLGFSFKYAEKEEGLVIIQIIK